MPTDQDPSARDFQRIEIRKNGPYVVYGNIPLVRKVQVVSEHGEPLTWRKTAELEGGEKYFLCRCGGSHNKPYCDGTHKNISFDGAETTETSLTAERQQTYPSDGNIVVKRDMYVCMESGFCANRFTSLPQMILNSNDTQARSLAIAMIERCPSGSYTYSMGPGEADIEPDLPVQIAVVNDMTSDGPIIGPLWVTGKVSIHRSDGQFFEIRNRVTLCRCGKSKIKPLCDGAHRELHITE